MSDQSKHVLNDYFEFYKTSCEKSLELFNTFNPFASHFQTDNTTSQEWQSLSPTVNALQKAMKNWIESSSENNDELLEHKRDLFENITQLNEYFIKKLTGNNLQKPVVKVDKKDRRFKDQEWETNPFFDLIKQFYLIYTQWINDVIDSNKHIDDKTRVTIKFYTKQITEALSPSNFIFSNPELLRETIEKKGENLLAGMKNFQEDLELSKVGNFQIKQNNNDPFVVGENIANTPGKVVFKNDLIELIQYNSSTDTVHEVPILIIPPFINKYYVLDLNEQKSMVRWLVEKNKTVFMISWINPDKKYADYSFDDYVKSGTLAAINAIKKHIKPNSIHTVGYCIGGTLMAITLAYLAATDKNNFIKSATFLASLVNFENPGELDVFIDEDQIAEIEKKMKTQGFFDGKDMAATFNALRPGDLFWNYVVNNYMLGKKPSSHDVLFWNSDTTRLPEKLHSDYLRQMYLKNNLVKNEFKILGKTIHLKNIKQDIYCVATSEDHIVPWASAYKIKQALGAKNIEFVLSNSGHIMGIIQGTSPVPKKYNYRTNSKNYKESDQWLNFAKKNIGSWWPHWNKWLNKNLGEKINTIQPETGELEMLYDAPGEYVKIK